MPRLPVFAALAALVFLTVPAWAGPESQAFGGDLFISGSGSSGPVAAERDLFASEGSITEQGRVAQDARLSGFTVDLEAVTVGSVDAAAGRVTLRAAIGQDLTAAGFTVRTAPTAITQGNARLAGGAVMIDGPIKGALMAAVGEFILNAPVNGDVWLVGQDSSFGPDAKIAGTLRNSAPGAVGIPVGVIAADRVMFAQIEPRGMMRDIGKAAWQDREFPALPSKMSPFASFIVTLAFFVVAGAIFLTFLPKPAEALRKSAQERPGMALLSRVIGLSILFGLVPISAMTPIGLPLVPFGLLALIVLWTLGYILDADVVAMRVLGAFGAVDNPAMLMRLMALALCVTAVAVLNFIPFVGWLANFALVLLGVGVMTRALFDRMKPIGTASARPDGQ